MSDPTIVIVDEARLAGNEAGGAETTNEQFPAFILGDLLFWPLRSKSLDELTKRGAVSASLLYGLGVILVNASWLGGDNHTFAPARAAAIPVGIACAVVNALFGVIPYILSRLSFSLSSQWGRKAYLIHIGMGLVATGCVATIAWQTLLWLYKYGDFYYTPEGDWFSIILLSLSVTLAIFFNVLIDKSNPQLRSLSAAVCLICTFLFVYLTQHTFYDSIPNDLGGGRLPEIRLIVKPTSVQTMQSAGLKVNDECVTSTASLVDDSGPAYTLLVRRTQIDPAQPPQTSASSTHPFFIDIDKSNVQAVVHKPFDWTPARFEAEPCWSGNTTGLGCEQVTPKTSPSHCGAQSDRTAAQ